MLMTCHACNRVIRYDNGSDRPIVHHVEQSGNSAVTERTVTKHCNCVLGLFFASGLFHTVSHAYRCAHAYASVYAGKWRQSTESIAAYIRTDRKLKLAEDVIQTPVWATGTKYRRSYGYTLCLHRAGFGFIHEL